jgi:diadenosine tetraphosphate (Ap4A) HIT family hydrolase
MPSGTTCVFCQIVSGQREAHFVHRDELVSAFMDIQPVTRGHLLVIPNEHAPGLDALPVADAERLFTAAQELARALRQSELRPDGFNLFLADGRAAGQAVFHAHLHVIPRYPGDNLGVRLPPDYHRRPAREELAQRAAQIRAARTR